ncbi:MAG: YdcF family protein [Betaproteobacteria bacterium]|nr:YdcF family protein [Betaproteobacteria bacterium]MCC6247011.1 YdcF family protein [Rubrivivax sp.]MCL4695594.1 YdcF family protein [Burkholderiaceae bacterium]
MNDFFLWLGLDAWRSVLGALVMPPVPFIVLVLIGARLFSRHRVRAWLVVLLGCLGLWASTTHIVGQGLTHWLLPPTRSLAPTEIAELKKAPRTAIVVLGAGHRDLAPEYGVSELQPMGNERLRYGLWLSRQTELPVLFTGGRSHGAAAGQSEAEIAARTAERDFNRPLRWTETESRDTRENALRSVALLKREGIERVVVVTHGYHMPRAMDNFRRAVVQHGANMQLVAAPMGIVPMFKPRALDFVPTRTGYQQVMLVLHEFFGRLVGA